jgi:hypothetical protein
MKKDLNKYYFLIILIFSFYSTLILANPMKTICSITINSSDEIEQFKKFMSPTDWKFIELTTLNVTNENKSDSPNNDWLSTS